MKNWKTKELKDLAKAFRSVDEQKDMLNFLRDLCTLEELDELSSRWEVVLLLNKGISYRKIAEKTHPDKTGDNSKAEMFSEASLAYQENN